MKTLTDYIKAASSNIDESISNNIKKFANLEWTVAYLKDYDDEGTCYTRRITIECTPEELKELNEAIWNSDYVQKSTSGIKYKKEDVELKPGKNYTRLSVSKFLDVIFGVSEKQAGKHNTEVKIEIV